MADCSNAEHPRRPTARPTAPSHRRRQRQSSRSTRARCSAWPASPAAASPRSGGPVAHRPSAAVRAQRRARDRRQAAGPRAATRKTPRTWRGTVVSLLPQGAMNSVSPTMRIGDLVYDVAGARRQDQAGRGAGPGRERFTQLDLPARVARRLPAPALRRHEAARRHRAVDAAQPAAADRRRTDLGAGRVEPGRLIEMLREMLAKRTCRRRHLRHPRPAGAADGSPTGWRSCTPGKIDETGLPRRSSTAAAPLHRGAAGSVLTGAADPHPAYRGIPGRRPTSPTRRRLPVPSAVQPGDGRAHTEQPPTSATSALRHVLVGRRHPGEPVEVKPMTSEVKATGMAADQRDVRAGVDGHPRGQEHHQDLRPRQERGAGPSTTSRSARRQARSSRSSARAAPASRRWPGWCCGCCRSRRAR